MEIIVGARAASVGAVKPDDVEILVLDPDAPDEAPFAGFGQGRDVEHKSPYLAEELAAYVVELIMCFVKSVCVQVDHLQESAWQEFHRELKQVSQATEEFLLDSAPGSSICQWFEFDTLRENRAAHEIPITGWNGAQILIAS